jgi:hypothetical protein
MSGSWTQRDGVDLCCLLAVITMYGVSRVAEASMAQVQANLTCGHFIY